MHPQHESASSFPNILSGFKSLLTDELMDRSSICASPMVQTLRDLNFLRTYVIYIHSSLDASVQISGIDSVPI